MSAIQFDLPGARVLDLFAGSGALGLEALSRGAAHATFVERDRRTIEVLRANVHALDAQADVTIVQQDAVVYVSGLAAGAFDLALADPPYGLGLAARLVERFIAIPYAHALWVEHGADEVLPELAGARTRRYGDTAITSYRAPL